MNAFMNILWVITSFLIIFMSGVMMLMGLGSVAYESRGSVFFALLVSMAFAGGLVYFVLFARLWIVTSIVLLLTSLIVLDLQCVGYSNSRLFGTLSVLGVVFLLGVFYLVPFLTGPATKESIVIVLNGPSASGKTSIQKEFQKFYGHQYLRGGIDSLYCALLDGRAFSGDSPVMKGEFKEVGGYKTFEVTYKEQGQKIIDGMHKAIAGYAEAGNNMIVDYICYDSSWIFGLVKELRPFKVYTVGFRTPLAVIEERERTRKTSPDGHARSHYESVHQGWIYDLEVDTEKESAAEIAQNIKNYIENHEPHAFIEMSRTFSFMQTLKLWWSFFLQG